MRNLALKARSEDEARAVVARIANISRQYRIAKGIGIPLHPLAQAQELDKYYVRRPHLDLLSTHIADAVRDVERGQNRRLAVSMPPRSGKSFLISQYAPLWMLRRHPEWPIVTASYDSALTSEWARKLRRIIESKPELGIALEADGGAGGQWKTEEGGGLYSTSVRGPLTGRGARVLIIDDPIKDFVEAHSLAQRNTIWNWWMSVAQTRLHPPYLVIVVMTRWHEDDFVGRIFSNDHAGDPSAWTRISLPALAESHGDILGREPGEPLFSPLIEETPQQAVERWEDVKRSVGTYSFAGMYQQRPAPAKGAIFDSSWWKYWTTDPEKATDDGRVVLFDPQAHPTARWLDSWDMAFKGTDYSDWVVVQRWVRHLANRYLIAQERGRWSFTQTLAKLEHWSSNVSSYANPYGNLVHQRLIEDAANGPAIMDTVKDKISGIKAIYPRTSKEARARAITPEIESGNVYLPHPADPGNEWVNDLLSELRNFPHDAHDDQVDSLTQALMELRDIGQGGVTVPGRGGRRIDTNRRIDQARSTRRFR